MDKEIKLREVKKEDLQLIYKWRNEPTIRENSLNKEEIKWSEHLRYWSERLDNAQNYSFIVVFQNADVGLVRLDKKSDSHEVSILIAPEYQKQGLGSAAIGKTKQIAREKGIRKLTAKVKPKNIASQKIFKNNNFEESHLVYECEI